MRHALFNTTFIGTDADKETSATATTSLGLQRHHEATKDTIEMLLQTVPDTPIAEDQGPLREGRHESPVRTIPNETV